MVFENIAVVVGNNSSTMLGEIQSLGEMKVMVDVCLVSKDKNEARIIKKSRYVHDFIIITTKDDNRIIETLINKYKDISPKAILFTTGDYFASLIDNKYDLLKQYFLLPYAKVDGLPVEGRINYLMDKAIQNRMARECGLDTMRECVFDLEGDFNGLEDVIYPCVAKPLISCKGKKADIKKCNNESELLAHFEGLKSQNAHQSVLVQEFVDVKDEVILTGVCLDQTVYAPVLSRRLMVAQYKKGLTITGEIMDLSYIGRYRDNYFELLKSFHYVGTFGMDVFLCQDGRIIFNEMNFRATGVIRGLTKAGFNVPYILYRYLADGTNVYEDNIRYGAVFFHDRVAWDEYIHRMLSKKQLKHFMDICDFHTLKDDKDNGPYRSFKRSCLVKQLKYLIKGK